MSMTSSPFPSNMIFTRFLPISCRSPFTVPIQTLPLTLVSLCASRGFRIPTPWFIARAAISTSGTKTSLFLNFTPITFNPASRPSSRICCAGIPSSIACCTSSFAAFALPACTFPEISCNNSCCVMALLSSYFSLCSLRSVAALVPVGIIHDCRADIALDACTMASMFSFGVCGATRQPVPRIIGPVVSR